MAGDHEAQQQGGMLSTVDIRRCIVPPELQEDYLAFFKKRKWDEIKNKWPEYEKGLVIREYNELNLTPFSYDMSIGNQLFSLQKPESGLCTLDKNDPNKSGYDLHPGETVVVITRELVAIPRHYSATMWPRFNFVLGGVFQSMVKIDPTWYGKLAVAITNVSPTVIRLEADQAFATLVLYELSEPSDVDLWKPSELVEVDVDVPEDFPLEGFDQFLLDKPDLGKRCRLVGRTLKVKGIKRGDVESLKRFHGSDAWTKFAEKQVGEGWATAEHPTTHRRMIGMEALGMEDLSGIFKVSGKGTRITDSDIVGRACSEQDLAAAAKRHGKPFDVFARIPHTVIERVESEVSTRLGAQIESSIQPRMVMLMFSVLGFLSLIIAVLALAARLGSLEVVDALAMLPGYLVFVFILAILVLSIFAVLVFKVRWGLRPRRGESIEDLRPTINELTQGLRKVENLGEELERLKAICRELKDGQRKAIGSPDDLGKMPPVPNQEESGE